MEKEIDPSLAVRLPSHEKDSEDTGDKDESTASFQYVHEDPLTRVISGPPYSIFSKSTKIFIVFLVSLSALVSPFAATLFYPALNAVAQQLNVSQSLVNLSITTYMVCQTVHKLNVTHG
jgi:hypothetical protein